MSLEARSRLTCCDWSLLTDCPRGNICKPLISFRCECGQICKSFFKFWKWLMLEQVWYISKFVKDPFWPQASMWQHLQIPDFSDVKAKMSMWQFWNYVSFFIDRQYTSLFLHYEEEIHKNEAMNIERLFFHMINLMLKPSYKMPNPSHCSRSFQEYLNLIAIKIKLPWALTSNQLVLHVAHF